MAARRRRLGRLALIAATLALASLSSEAMSASSRVCRQLEAELASGSAGGRSATQARKQDAAIARQREQLQLAKRQSRGAGCGFRLFGGSTSSCGAINLKVEKMERNLEALQRRRSKAIDAGSGRSRSQIMAALQANGCRDDAMAERRLPRGLDGTRNLLDQIFGGTTSAGAGRSRNSAYRPTGGTTTAMSAAFPTPADGSTMTAIFATPRLRAATGRSACALATATISRCRAPRPLRSSSATR